MKSGTDHSYTYMYLLATSPITQNLTTQHIMEKDINNSCIGELEKSTWISVNILHNAEACTFKV